MTPSRDATVLALREALAEAAKATVARIRQQAVRDFLAAPAVREALQRGLGHPDCGHDECQVDDQIKELRALAPDEDP